MLPIPTKIITRLVRLLHSNISSKEIALGVAVGMLIGLQPTFSLLTFFLFILLFILNTNISAGFLSIFIFKILGYILDPLAHKIGCFLLIDVRFLERFWTSLYNMPIVPFTRFYNSIVLGSFVIGLVLFIPTFLLTEKFIVFYRKSLAQKIEQFKIIKLLKLTKLYKIYSTYKDLK